LQQQWQISGTNQTGILPSYSTAQSTVRHVVGSFGLGNRSSNSSNNSSGNKGQSWQDLHTVSDSPLQSSNSSNRSGNQGAATGNNIKQAKTSLARSSHGQRQPSTEQQQKRLQIVSYSYAATVCWQQTQCNCFKVLLQGCSNSRNNSGNSSISSGSRQQQEQKQAATAAADRTISATATTGPAATT